jgi:hypothetical protein
MKIQSPKFKSLSYFIALILGLALLIWNSCKDEIVGSRNSSVVFPDSNVSYSKHVEILFQETCAVSGCHAGNNSSGRLNLTPPSYDSLMNHPVRLVIATQSTNSLLVQRLEGLIGERMPPRNFTPLTANQIKGIKRWIDEGAANN